MKDIAEKRCAQ